MIYIYTIDINGQVFESTQPDCQHARRDFVNFISDVLVGEALKDFMICLETMEIEFEKKGCALSQWQGADICITKQTHFGTASLQ